jgi:hypothetical protein
MGRQGMEEYVNLLWNINLLARDPWDVPGRRHGRKKCILSDLRFP